MPEPTSPNPTPATPTKAVTGNPTAAAAAPAVTAAAPAVTPTPAANPAVTPTPAPATPAPAKPGYFNQAQLSELVLGEDVLEAANSHPPLVASNRLTAPWLTNYGATLKIARKKVNDTGQAKDTAITSTSQATGTELALIDSLHGIQSARKQQRRMGQMEDPVVNYSLDGYFIGARLNPSRSDLLQNALALIAKATSDALPSYDAAAIAVVQDAFDAYENDKTQQGDDQEAKEQDRIDRDALIAKITAGRQAIQHAADAVWPYTNDANTAIRNAFELPPNRPLA